jgi:hypothetical protein
MSEKHVLIATFTLPAEALAACGRLRGEGIPTYVTRDVTPPAVSGLAARVELYVPEMACESAARIVEEYLEEQPAAAEPRRPGEDEGLWLCSLCGNPVRVELTVCPACGTARPAPEPQHERGWSAWNRRPRRPSEQLTPTPAPARLGTDIDLSALKTSAGERLARRSLRAAVVCLLCSTFIFPLGGGCFGALAVIPFVLLPFWFLMQLLAYQGELSRGGLRKLYLAAAIDVVMLLALMIMLVWVYYLLRG